MPMTYANKDVLEFYKELPFNYRESVEDHVNAVRQRKITDLYPVLRVRPETLCRITEFSEHESNGRELDEGERGVLPS